MRGHDLAVIVETTITTGGLGHQAITGDTLASPRTGGTITATRPPQNTTGVRSPVTEVETDVLQSKGKAAFGEQGCKQNQIFPSR